MLVSCYSRDLLRTSQAFVVGMLTKSRAYGIEFCNGSFHLSGVAAVVCRALLLDQAYTHKSLVQLVLTAALGCLKACMHCCLVS